jgi:hypothetical protein
MMFYQPRSTKEVVREFVQNNFQAIPQYFFDLIARNAFDLISSPYYVCPKCGKGQFLTADNNVVYVCTGCNKKTMGQDLWPGEPENFPGSYECSWYCDGVWKEVTDVASSYGFHVWEYEDEPGFILSLDPIGYDVIEQHWMPLYNHLGLKDELKIKVNINTINKQLKNVSMFDTSKAQLIPNENDMYHCTQCGDKARTYLWLFEDRCEILCQACVNSRKKNG